MTEDDKGRERLDQLSTRVPEFSDADKIRAAIRACTCPADYDVTVSLSDPHPPPCPLHHEPGTPMVIDELLGADKSAAHRRQLTEWLAAGRHVTVIGTKTSPTPYTAWRQLNGPLDSCVEVVCSECGEPAALTQTECSRCGMHGVR